jgi:hypothetical protein
MKQSRLKLTIAGPLVIIAVLLVAFGSVGWVGLRLGDDNLRAVTSAVSRPLTFSAAELLFGPLKTGNLTEINRILNRYTETDAIVFTAVSDSTGKRVVQASKTWTPDEAVSAALARQAMEKNQAVEELAGTYLLITAPIGLDGRVIGAVEFVFDKKALSSSLGSSQMQIIFIAAITLVGAALLFFFLIRFAILPLARLASAAANIGSGDLFTPVRVEGVAEVASLALSLDGMRTELLKSYQGLQNVLSGLEQRVSERTAIAEAARAEAEAARHQVEAQMWLAAGQAALAEKMRGEQEIHQLANNIIIQLSQYLGAQAGTLYLRDDKTLKRVAGYACVDRPGFSGEFQLGQGLVGQVAVDQRPTLIACPEDAAVISTGLVDASPSQVLIAPVEENGQVVGVVELATLAEFTQTHLDFLARVSESMGVAFRTAQARQRLSTLLAESQRQTEELQAQEEELRAANEELHAQAERLNYVRQISVGK